MHHFHIALWLAVLTLLLVACGRETPDDATVAVTAATIEPVAQLTEESPTVLPASPTETRPSPTHVPTLTPTLGASPFPTEAVRPTATVVPTEPPAAAPERELVIRTLLPPDAIPSIDNPQFFESIEEADEVYGESELVLGVEIDGDARAYSVPLLSSHEIVNDTIAGQPIAVTW